METPEECTPHKNEKKFILVLQNYNNFPNRQNFSWKKTKTGFQPNENPQY
jgi:hypothetical protein